MIDTTFPIERAFLSDIGERVATAGLGALADRELTDLLRAGCHAEVAPPVLTVLADDAAPEVVRVRALGRVLRTLDRRDIERPTPVLATTYVLVPPTPEPVSLPA